MALAGAIILADDINAIVAPGWTDYSLAWTAFTTNPVLGNGTINYSQYRRAPGSDLITVRFKITFGSTTTYGSGVWFFSLPVAAGANEVGNSARGGAWALDAGVKESGGVVKVDTTTRVRLSAAPVAAGTSDNWSSATPFTWGSTDAVAAEFSYHTT